MWPEDSSLAVWTRRADDREMESADTVVQALARIGRNPTDTLVLVCDPTGSGSEDLDAFVQVTEELGAPRNALIVTTPHPSIAWLTALIDRGLSDIRYHPDRDCGRPDTGGLTIAESLNLLCPNLHTTQSRGVVLSVCGEHCDHLVLSSRQVAHQCTRNFRDCPYRRSTSAHV